MTDAPAPTLPRVCLHPHLEDALDNYLVAHINMGTMLAVQLAQTMTALRSAKAALEVGPKSIRNHATVKTALAVIEDVLP